MLVEIFTFTYCGRVP